MNYKVASLCKIIFSILASLLIYNTTGVAQKMYTGFDLQLIPERDAINAEEMVSFTVKAFNFGDEVRNVFIILQDPENNYSSVIGGTKWNITVAPGETKVFNFSVTPKYLTPYQLVVLKYNFTRFFREGINAVAKIKILDYETLLDDIKLKNNLLNIESIESSSATYDTASFEYEYLELADSNSIILDLTPSDNSEGDNSNSRKMNSRNDGGFSGSRINTYSESTRYNASTATWGLSGFMEYKNILNQVDKVRYFQINAFGLDLRNEI